MFTSLANLATKHSKSMIAMVVVVAFGCVAASTGLVDRLSTRGFQNDSAESARSVLQMQKATGSDPDGTVTALVTPGGRVDSRAGRERVAEVAKLLAAEADMGNVVTPFAGGTTIRALLARDGKSAVVVGELKPGLTEGEADDRLPEAFAGQKDVLLGGGLIAQHTVSKTVESDLRRAEMLAFPLLFILSLFVFRGLIAAALPVLVGGLTIPITYAVIGAADQVTDLSVFALNLTTGLGLGLAIDYSLLLVTRFREELEAGKETAEAVRVMVATAGRTIVFSSLTVAGALAVLGIFPLKFLYSMAVSGATVALVAGLVSLTLIPAMLALLGPRINKFSVSRKPFDHATGRWRGMAQGVMKRPVAVALSTTALLLVCGLPIANIQFTSVDATVLPKQTSPFQVEQAMQNDFPDSEATADITAVVKADRGDAALVNTYAERVAADPSVRKTLPPRYLGNETWRLDVFPDGARYSPAAQDAVASTRALTGDLRGAGHEVLVGNNSAFFVDQRATIVDRVPLALALIGGITFVVLFLMTGSVVLPIKTFVMNMLTLLATFGILVFIFQDGRFEGLLDYTSQSALEMTQPVLLFAMAFGLSTDYGVMLLGRIKEIHDSGVSNEEAVVEGVARTGRVITAAALLFCVAIGAFSTSQIIFVKELGFGTALAVAIDATIVRALLVPSLMALMGKWNWWAPRPLTRLHERIGLSEGPSAGTSMI